MTALLTPAALAEINHWILCEQTEVAPWAPHLTRIIALRDHAAAQAERIAALEAQLADMEMQRDIWIKAGGDFGWEMIDRVARLRAVAVAVQPHFMDGHLPLGDPVGDALAALQPGDLP